MELGLKITQNQVLAPQMEQSVRILQMDSAQWSISPRTACGLTDRSGIDSVRQGNSTPDFEI